MPLKMGITCRNMFYQWKKTLKKRGSQNKNIINFITGFKDKIANIVNSKCIFFSIIYKKQSNEKLRTNRLPNAHSCFSLDCMQPKRFASRKEHYNIIIYSLIISQHTHTQICWIRNLRLLTSQISHYNDLLYNLSADRMSEILFFL